MKPAEEAVAIKGSGIVKSSVKDAKAIIQRTTDVEWLEAALEWEQGGKNRTSLTALLEAKIKKLGKVDGAGFADEVCELQAVDLLPEDCVAVGDIEVFYNPRKKFAAKELKELSTSIKHHGIVQPLVVRLGESGKLVLVAGERRLRAAKSAGLECVPVVVRDLGEREAMEIALVENLQRVDLDVLEEAEGFHDLMGVGWSVVEMAERFGRSRDYIQGRLELRKLPDDIKGAVNDKSVTLHVARALGRVDSDDDRKKALEKIVKPSYQEEPLKQDAALKLIKREYVDPQEEAKKWDGREKRLVKEYAGAEFVSYAEREDYVMHSSDFVSVGDIVPWWDLTDEYKTKSQMGNGDVTWEDVLRKSDAQRYIVCGSDGEPVIYVSEELARLADAEYGGKGFYLKRAAAALTEEERLEEEREQVQAVQKKEEYERVKGAWLGGMLKRVKVVGVTQELVMSWYDNLMADGIDLLDEVEVLLKVNFKSHETEGRYCDENYAQCREMVEVLAGDDAVNTQLSLMYLRDMNTDYAGGMTGFARLFSCLDEGEEEFAAVRVPVGDLFDAAAVAEAEEKAEAVKAAAEAKLAGEGDE